MEKNIFVYGTLKSGERNHYHFKDCVSNIVEGTIEAALYHLEDYDCPSIRLESGTIEGQIIYYTDDEENSIELAVDDLEQSTPGLYYDRVPVTVQTLNGAVESEVYVVRDFENLKSTKLNKAW